MALRPDSPRLVRCPIHGCWEWTFECIYGWLPSEVMHRCDNPLCFNPAHLTGGTHAENMRDCGDKGRSSNQRKKRCPQGHSYVAENLIRCGPDGRYRRCRICFNDQRRARRASRARYVDESMIGDVL